jgi:subtilisin family serine protease
MHALRFYLSEVLRPPSVTNPRAERDKTHGGVGGRSAAQCSAASFPFRRPLNWYPQHAAGRVRSKPQLEPPPPSDRRRPFFVAALLAVTLLLGSDATARGDVCVVVDPVVSIGRCTASAPANASPRTSSSAQSEEAVPLSSTSVEYDPQHIAVTAEPWASSRRLTALFEAAGVEVEQHVGAIDAYLLRVAPNRQAAALRALRSSRAVAEAAPDVIAHTLDTTPNDNEWPLQSGLRVVGLPRAWDMSRGSSKLVVAVVDTGVDANQADLGGALVQGANFVDPSAPPRDDHGHGTAVAGIVAARSNNGQGMAGVCWFCAVMPVKVLDASGSGDDTRIAAGIVWAADHGARVINLSLGGPGDTPELDAALEYASGKGAVVVAAAGNSGTTVPFYPAANANALSVAATTTADRAYPWSNHGPWVNVAAPGCNVAPGRGTAYQLFCGTSSAAPIVAGLAALALSERPDATPSDVRRAIEGATTPLPGFVQFGRVSAPGALAVLSTRRVVQLHAVLTRARPVWTYDVRAAPGTLDATVRFRRGAVATLSVDSATQVTGASPLRLTASGGGPVRVTVRTKNVPLRITTTLSFTP